MTIPAWVMGTNWKDRDDGSTHTVVGSSTSPSNLTHLGFADLVLIHTTCDQDCWCGPDHPHVIAKHVFKSTTTRLSA